jgi:hypothetical protein
VAQRDGEGRAEAEVKLKNLQSYRTAETGRFAAASAKAPLTTPPPPDARTGAEKLEDAAKRAGQKIEDKAEKAGDAIKDAVR